MSKTFLIWLFFNIATFSCVDNKIKNQNLTNKYNVDSNDNNASPINQSNTDKLISLLDDKNYYSLPLKYVSNEMNLNEIEVIDLINHISNINSNNKINIFEYEKIWYIGLQNKYEKYLEDKHKGVNKIEEKVKKGLYKSDRINKDIDIKIIWKWFNYKTKEWIEFPKETILEIEKIYKNRNLWNKGFHTTKELAIDWTNDKYHFKIFNADGVQIANHEGVEDKHNIKDLEEASLVDPKYLINENMHRGLRKNYEKHIWEYYKNGEYNPLSKKDSINLDNLLNQYKNRFSIDADYKFSVTPDDKSKSLNT